MTSHCPLPKRYSKTLSFTNGTTVSFHHVLKGLLLCKKTVKTGEPWWKIADEEGPTRMHPIIDAICFGTAHGVGHGGAQRRRESEDAAVPRLLSPRKKWPQQNGDRSYCKGSTVPVLTIIRSTFHHRKFLSLRHEFNAFLCMGKSPGRGGD